jgi:predicted flap endonuclease-1-like 5' DNA nuclease
MSSISQLEIVDDAHELRDDEFTLDAEELDAPEPTVIRQRLRGRPPPPPPPRRPKPALTAEVPVTSNLPSAVLDVHARSGRRISGVYTVDERTGLHTAVLPSRTLAEATGEITRLSAQMRARDAYLAELERVVADYRQQLTAAGLSNLDELARLSGRVRGQAFRIAELESELRRVHTSASQSEQRASTAGAAGITRPELLRRVRGIGRRYAEQLAALGVDSVDQIARWTEQDGVHIAGQLRISPTRVTPWIEQARALVAESRETTASAASHAAPDGQPSWD